ncbi:hypothetical protein H696_04830 [Fonticula alba]|uniref:Uncharacterized protein n=1 Tax=Fonticula alba TaxID=691883 RepID=A0A058Z3R2_FONAL|nr:hypothetical protein H696_04830 [Fonticula alba]KCV68538.1 hypothetical protein H696_04830 [Fonticula alba]|eukprot:XP_009496970.1 hypothetical protein H696_04830 [Fonticula alba]
MVAGVQPGKKRPPGLFGPGRPLALSPPLKRGVFLSLSPHPRRGRRRAVWLPVCTHLLPPTSFRWTCVAVRCGARSLPPSGTRGLCSFRSPRRLAVPVHLCLWLRIELLPASSSSPPPFPSCGCVHAREHVSLRVCVV